ncbi:uncharacterized protein [Solanum tuberosum]|uniref:uncharacterized protein isoform X3 n=1 Tax=Solanum tuberosum TaxID=4113 RepID=UPI00073A2AFC|nr:PREDICTED: uncharacterized protein LOC102593851 isoform X3 [Solanum tuberosum]
MKQKTIGYDPYNTDIKRLAHCPDRVEEDQWHSVVHYWSSKEAKVPDNPLEDCQQPSAFVPGVHTRKANMIKKTGTSVVGTNKKKWNFQGN